MVSFGVFFHQKVISVKKCFLSVLALLALSACTPKLVEQLPYYKLSVIQGIPIDKDAILALKPGMTREQVQLYLGAPLLRSSFRSDRWDYTYEVIHGGKVKENRNLIVYFQGNMLSRVEGSALDYLRQQPQNHQGAEQ